MGARAAGLLVHPTALPGPFGVGDLGPATVRFLDWAAEAGQTIWQFLPLGPTDDHHSPYATRSSWAGNPLLISPERLMRDGWLGRDELPRTAHAAQTGGVDFARTVPWKRRLLHRAWRRFRDQAPVADRDRFEAFVEDPLQRGWLEDWAVFAARCEHAPGAPRAGVDSDRTRAARRELAAEIAEQRWLQFVFFEQWSELRSEAHARGIRLFGDLPFYVAPDGADVWSRPDLFRLDAAGRPTHVGGVPPDAFSADGQLWGNPLYRWDALEREDFAWWVERVRAGLRTADLLRLDHFRGFAAFWEVAAGAETAAAGRWVAGPGRRPFDVCARVLGALPFVAEDLGVITPDVHALRATLGLPGTRVLQFAFGDADGELHSPRTLSEDVVAYTGTHDNDTLRGWFERLPGAARARVLQELGADERDVVWRAVAALYQSAARLVVVALQDVFELGSEARMNLPGSVVANWRWRADASAFTLDRAARLRRLAERSART